MVDTVKEFFVNLYNNVNGFSDDVYNKALGLIEPFISSVPGILKLIGLVFTALFVVLGAISFAKKLFKLFIVLILIAAILGAIIYFTQMR